ncbi:hypothetical protein [Streptomyces antarcticus]|uniref:hypothetical protein n=1 Tax=Streptomyces antarcticus TaxID=2996458 RepID=UPI00226D78D1|nr:MULTISPECIES: hypothetical protein [unclassified Streptomyces]MCY0940126.1 hypothetical protein [Streptomyces sp. H34-AA3]MCZ4080774.1 hypothetical protein [Streptomyces sp. H34-S5]
MTLRVGNNGVVHNGASYELARAMRDIVLGQDPPVQLTERAVTYLAQLRETAVDTTHPGGTVITRAPAMMSAGGPGLGFAPTPH